MTKSKLNADQLAEQAGHQTAVSAIEAMHKSPTQAARLEILIDGLIDVYCTSAGGESALIGFAVGLLGTLENGMGLQK